MLCEKTQIDCFSEVIYYGCFQLIGYQRGFNKGKKNDRGTKLPNREFILFMSMSMSIYLRILFSTFSHRLFCMDGPQSISVFSISSPLYKTCLLRPQRNQFASKWSPWHTPFRLAVETRGVSVYSHLSSLYSHFPLLFTLTRLPLCGGKIFCKISSPLSCIYTSITASVSTEQYSPSPNNKKLKKRRWVPLMQVLNKPIATSTSWVRWELRGLIQTQEEGS